MSAARVIRGRYRAIASLLGPDDLEPGEFARITDRRYILRDPDGGFSHADEGEYTISGNNTACITAEPPGSPWRIVRGVWTTEEEADP